MCMVTSNRRLARGWMARTSISDLVWKNPHLDKTINSIDFTAPRDRAAPFWWESRWNEVRSKPCAGRSLSSA
jgi:hypothetical protein